MKISVTQEDIDHGKAGQCETCPVALAIRRALPRRKVQVTGRCAFFLLEDGCIRVPLPNEVYIFVMSFDCEYTVQPFDFELPITNEQLQVITQ